MTEIPIFVNTNEVTVGGLVDQVELQLSVGAQGERGSRIFSGDVSPLSLPVDSPYFAGYTEFISGDVYIERSLTVLAIWEWKSQPGGYTWVKTADIAMGEGGSVTLDADLEAIAALTGTSGLLRKTATNTWVLDTSSYQGADSDLTAIAALTGTGYLKRTGVNTWVLDVSGGGTGDVVGPGSATDNAVARFDTTTGKLIQNSGVTIDDYGKTITPAATTSSASINIPHGVAPTTPADGDIWTTSGNMYTMINGVQYSLVKTYEELLSTSASLYTVTHNLGTSMVDITVREANSPYEVVYTTTSVINNNQVTIRFASIVSANTYRAIIMARST